DAARERDAVVHFDGARLWESTVHFGRPLDEIAGLADSVYVSVYKSLKGYGGAALAGPRTLVDEAKTWRHRYGGSVFQQFPTVLSALAGLERELPRLPEYVAHAREVAAALREGLTAAGVPWTRVHPEVPHTHQFQVWLPCAADVAADAAVRQGEETGTLLFAHAWNAPGPGLAVTEVAVEEAGLRWTADDVRKAAAGFVARVAGAAGWWGAGAARSWWRCRARAGGGAPVTARCRRLTGAVNRRRRCRWPGAPCGHECAHRHHRAAAGEDHRRGLPPGRARHGA